MESHLISLSFTFPYCKSQSPLLLQYRVFITMTVIIVSIPLTAIASTSHARSSLNHIPGSLENTMTFHLTMSQVSMVQRQNRRRQCLWQSTSPNAPQWYRLAREKGGRGGKKEGNYIGLINLSLLLWLFSAYTHLSLSINLVPTEYPWCMRHYTRHWGASDHCPQGTYCLVEGTDTERSPNWHECFEGKE